VSQEQMSPRQLRELTEGMTAEQLRAALAAVIRVSPGLARNVIEAATRPTADEARAENIRRVVAGMPPLGPTAIADLDRLLNGPGEVTPP
jgi:hypothetical protein